MYIKIYIPKIFLFLQIIQIPSLFGFVALDFHFMSCLMPSKTAKNVESKLNMPCLTVMALNQG